MFQRFFIPMTWFIDAHEDLAWNINHFQRDYSRSAFETRQLEANTSIPAANGDTMLGWPEYNQASVRIVFGTLFAAPAKPNQDASSDHEGYHSPAEANQFYWNQLEIYHKLCDEKPHAFRLVTQPARPKKDILRIGKLAIRSLSLNQSD